MELSLDGKLEIIFKEKIMNIQNVQKKIEDLIFDFIDDEEYDDNY